MPGSLSKAANKSTKPFLCLLKLVLEIFFVYAFLSFLLFLLLILAFSEIIFVLFGG